jgi:hypothetical protein
LRGDVRRSVLGAGKFAAMIEGCFALENHLKTIGFRIREGKASPSMLAVIFGKSGESLWKRLYFLNHGV